MTSSEKQKIITEIVSLLAQLAETKEETTPDATAKDEKIEMLTVKECTEVVKGLSEHTVRQLVVQGKIPCVRAGQGKNGKILISKSALINYLGAAA